MAYATLGDVLDAGPKLVIGPNTKPSSQDAQAILDRIHQHVDSVLTGLGYALPITKASSPQAFDVLKDIVVRGALARLLKAMFYGVRNPEEVGANDAWREYQLALKNLADPNHPLTLPDAAQHQWAAKVGGDLSSNFLTSSFEEPEPLTRFQEF